MEIKETKETFFTGNVEYAEGDEDFKEALASLNYNKDYAIPIKYVFTDAFANANKQQVPEDEFDNIIRTGQSMPIKAGELEAGIPDGHDGASPLGVITHLKKAGATVIGLGLLWKQERPEVVEYIRNAFREKKSLQLSWELGYTDSTFSDDKVETLAGVVVRAITFVGLPAYEGRTPVLAVASKDKEDNTKDMEELQTKIEELTTLLAEKDASILSKDEQIAGLIAERDTLAEYKAGVEGEKELEARLDAIKGRFQEAKIEKPEEYFAEKKDNLLALEENELDFLLQEMLSFASASKVEDEKDGDNGIPNLTSDSTSVKNVSEIVKALRERK